MRMEKMVALHGILAKAGMMVGTTSSYVHNLVSGVNIINAQLHDVVEDEEDNNDGGPVDGDCNPGSSALSDVKLATRIRGSHFCVLQ